MRGIYKYPVLATSIGGTIELFDFSIFLFLSDYLLEVFLPQAGSKAYIFIALSVTGYIARPLGGIVFGYLGDQIGRKKTFIYSIIMMSIATLGIIALPVDNSISNIAFVCLIIIRFLQGFSAGGEMPIGFVFVAEHIRVPQRGASTAQFCIGCESGYTLGYLCTYLLTTYLPHEQIIAGGWRIPFVIGSAMGLICIIIRTWTVEPAVFLTVTGRNKSPNPLKEVIFHHYKKLIVGIALIMPSAGALSGLLLIFSVVSSLKSERNEEILLAFALVLSSGVFALICSGKLSDKWGRKKPLIISASSIIFSSLLFLMINPSLSSWSLYFYLIVIAIAAAIGRSVAVCTVLEMFPVRIRCTGLAIAYNIGFSLFTGIGLLGSLFWDVNREQPFYLPVTYLVLTALATLIAVNFIPELHKKDIDSLG